MITITPGAAEQIRAAMQAEKKDGLALRFGVRGRGPTGFAYRLGFVDAAERQATDASFDSGGVTVLVDADSLPLVDGSTIDFVSGPREQGFKIENPNPLWPDPLAAAVQGVLDRDINPAVGQHGGSVTLLDVKDGVAFIALGGGCQGCGMVDVTLRQGIEVRIREVVPQIREIVDTTDHAGGRNPYYQPAKGGASPFGQ